MTYTPARQRRRVALIEPVMRMKKDRYAVACRQRRGGQYSRTIDIQQVELGAVQQAIEDSSLPPDVPWKLQEVAEALVGGSIRATRSVFAAKAMRANRWRQRAISGKNNLPLPAALFHGGQNVQQAQLRPSHHAKLIEKHDPHPSFPIFSLTAPLPGRHAVVMISFD